MHARKLKVESQSSDRPKAPKLVRIISSIGFIVLYAPFVSLFIYSFLERTADGMAWTLRWYREAFTDAVLGEALWRSLVIGFWATLVATIIGTAAAVALERFQFRGKKLLDTIILIPVVMPEIVLGLSLLVWFALLKISLGTFSIVLAHVTFCLSFVVITVRARLAEFDSSLEAAARDLGARGNQVFWRVTFPLILPGILSGALMAFTLSFDDFLISFFTAGVDSDTLPMKIYAMIKFGISPKINAISSILFLVTLFTVFAIFPLQKKKSAH